MILFLSFVGCATTKQLVPVPDLNKIGGNEVVIQATRDSAFTGAACGLEVKDNGTPIGVLAINGKIEWVRPSGPMTIDVRDTLSSIKYNSLTIQTEQGHKYELELSYPFVAFALPGGTVNKDAVSLKRIVALDQTNRFALENENKEAIVPQIVETQTPTEAPGDIDLSSAVAGNYYALIIGNSEYQDLPQLKTPTQDARSLAEILKQTYGFNVKTLINVKRAEIIRVISNFRTELTSHDNLLIFFAGHGWLDQEADEGYWLPIDARKDDPANWISNATITSAIRAIHAKHVLVIADSCYSGKLTRAIQISQGQKGAYAEMARRHARIAISSGGLEPVLDGGGGGNHSVFANALIKALNNNSTVIDSISLFSQLRKHVGWNADQLPEYGVIHKAGHDGGDFLFINKSDDLSSPKKANK